MKSLFIRKARRKRRWRAENEIKFKRNRNIE
jgi:hypothetical protein